MGSAGSQGPEISIFQPWAYLIQYGQTTDTNPTTRFVHATTTPTHRFSPTFKNKKDAVVAIVTRYNKENLPTPPHDPFGAGEEFVGAKSTIASVKRVNVSVFEFNREASTTEAEIAALNESVSDNFFPPC